MLPCVHKLNQQPSLKQISTWAHSNRYHVLYNAKTFFLMNETVTIITIWIKLIEQYSKGFSMAEYTQFWNIFGLHNTQSTRIFVFRCGIWLLAIIKIQWKYMTWEHSNVLTICQLLQGNFSCKSKHRRNTERHYNPIYLIDPFVYW